MSLLVSSSIQYTILTCSSLSCRLDRKKQRKIQNWPDYHRTHVTAFEHYLDVVRTGGTVEFEYYDPVAFNNYLRWFLESTHIEIVKHAYEEEILEEPILFDEVGQSQYNRLVRQGRSTSLASSLNFVVICSLC